MPQSKKRRNAGQKLDDGQRYLSAESPTDEVWDHLKSKNLKITTAYLRGSDVQKRRGTRCLFCSDLLLFGIHASSETGELKHKLKAAQFCKIRLCPVCMQRKSLRWKARFHKAWPKIREAYPKARYMHLVLTMRNCHVSELGENIQKLNAGWRRLMNRNTWPADGFMRSVEVTREMDYCPTCKGHAKARKACPDAASHTYNANAHAHIHALLQVSETYFKKGYISQERWAEMWGESLGVDYKPVVSVSAIKPSSKGDQTMEDAVAAAVKEVAKYTIKFDDLVDFLDREGGTDWFLALDEQLEGTRAVSVGGSLKKFMSEKDPTDKEMIRPEDEDAEAGAIVEYREYLFNRPVSKYALHRILSPEEYEPRSESVSDLPPG